jgi:hypothetical protein
MSSFFLRLAAACLLGMASMSFAAAQTAEHFDCTPSFPLRQPWLGADDAYSIPLPDGRDVWIFGDTLYGKQRLVHGDAPEMVRNSIGVSTCKAGQWNIDYTIRHDAGNKYLDFFQEHYAGTWYWAMDGVEYDQALWVTLLCVRNSPKASSAALGFEICGTDLAQVTKLGADPNDWKVAYYPLVPETLHANPSASAVVYGDNLYLFTLYEEGSRPTVLTRIPLAGLQTAAKNLQYLGSDNQWHAGFVPAQAKPVMQHGAAEMSVRYHPELKKWISVLVDPVIFSDKVLLRTAPSLEGPWTDGDVIYHIPEMQKNSPEYDKDTFCYAGKEHPEFEKGDLVFTYVCNTMNVKKLETEMGIYYPKVVRMKMPAAAD